ncbi:MAG TPA: hypothetical protein VHT73_16620 [Thermodesulfobacteriota bacterium]|nr:hypothetical protein [Thermodesulfobacteriota bacterium]
MTDKEQKQGQEQPTGQPGGIGIGSSIAMAFNLGVSAHQQTQGQGRSVIEIAGELGEVIYSNLSRAYGGQQQEEFIRANTEYFLQIALLGYIVPGVCAFDAGFKDRLLGLIETKASQAQATQGSQQGKNIITP